MVAAVLSTSHMMSPIPTVAQKRFGPSRDGYRWTPIGGTPGNTARITSTGQFSNNQGIATGEAFGVSATVSIQGTAIGNGASAAPQGVAVGQGANGASANGAVIIGVAATGNGGGSSVAIGQSASATTNGVVIGNGASNALSTGSIAIGQGATSNASTFVAGSATCNSQDVYFGKGITNSSPGSMTLHGTGGTGSNIAGGNAIVAGGIGTGTGFGGNVALGIALATGTGSTANSLVNVLTLSGTSGGVSIVSPSGTTVPLVLTPASGTTADICQWTNNFNTTVLGRIDSSGNLNLNNPGGKIFISASPVNANCSAGSGQLTSGTATISTTAVTLNSLIFVTDSNAGVANLGSLAVGARTPGTSFVVTSSNVLDTSTFSWFLIN